MTLKMFLTGVTHALSHCERDHGHFGHNFRNELIGTPRGKTTLLKNGLGMMTILSCALITTSCRTDDTAGVLVGRFAEEALMISAIAIPPAEDGQFPMYFALHQRERVCLLTGQIPVERVLFFGSCEGISGAGKISCNDGRSLDVQWKLSSCQGGYGRSVDATGSNFYFGFELNEERALDQLRKGQQQN